MNKQVTFLETRSKSGNPIGRACFPDEDGSRVEVLFEFDYGEKYLQTIINHNLNGTNYATVHRLAGCHNPE
jgi:hypothetical protein